MDELNKLTKASKDAIISLAAEFKFARELADLLKKLEKDQGHVKQAIRDANKMLHVYKWLARTERKTARREGRIRQLTSEVLEKLPPGGGEYPLLEKMTKKLSIADKHLQKLASYYTGALGKDIREIEKEEELLRSLLTKGKHSKEAEALRTRLTAEMRRLDADLNELLKWINSNIITVEGIERSNIVTVDVIESWARGLGKKRALERKASQRPTEEQKGPYHWWTSMIERWKK
ncbi:hypothetical protein J4210_06275 [Candidatus Woesearchaeota archaeon]|nr:hypothetical protein [Candidatus Woesearchaeota archaeon]